ncbi:MAG: RNA methyltransferase [Chloroflexi bacterium]|nr:RNA methyltransferase [Chloroflexota bacterium]
MITSTHNSKIQLVRGLLGRSKERRETGAFVAEGVRLVEEALAAEWPFRFVLAGESLSERGQTLVKKLEVKSIEVELVTDTLLRSISETETSQGILAVLDFFLFPIPYSPSFALILDQIRDPGNLGTLLRTAAAAGVQAVFLPPETTEAFAPKVVRAGMGAHFRIPIYPLTWDEIRTTTKGLKIHLADMEGAISCWQADFRSPLALIVGGEADGTSQPARELATSQVSIPMPGKTESLNAAVAGAILMFEVVRQRT